LYCVLTVSRDRDVKGCSDHSPAAFVLFGNYPADIFEGDCRGTIGHEVDGVEDGLGKRQI
jgi:hypothetical protein